LQHAFSYIAFFSQNMLRMQEYQGQLPLIFFQASCNFGLTTTYRVREKTKGDIIMEHLALEVFDRVGMGSQYAALEPDASITITDTSEIFASGDVWSHSFTLNVYANAHIFGTAGEIHGSRLHEQINKRKARLWVEGLPLYLGYLTLGDEAEVDAEGNVDVKLESGQKTFEEMIEGTSAQEVSVGDVVIGVALNRKRVSNINIYGIRYRLDGLEAFLPNYPEIMDIYANEYDIYEIKGKTPYTQQWPKLVKSNGEFLDSSGTAFTKDYTNIQTPYDASHPFCNINICYPYKSIDEGGEEKVGRAYIKRLAHSNADTTDGGDNQTRFNNAPNFYLLYFIDRLFKDLGIYVEENQAKDVEDLRRIFMLNFGCHYEEIENTSLGNGVNYLDTPDHLTPSALLERYGQYYMQIIRKGDQYSLIEDWDGAGQYTHGEAKGLDHVGKVLLRNFKATLNGTTYLELGSVEGIITGIFSYDTQLREHMLKLDRTTVESASDESKDGYYSSYLAYATGENYPDVEISEIIEAMKSMFGVRLLFSDDYKRVRIVLLRNVFRSQEVQEINCDIVDDDVKVENNIRGFRMTYGKGSEDTSYYYKGFNDLFPRQSTTWKDTTDRHDYSQWKLDADYATIKQSVSPSNKTCFVTPVNGNAYGVKIDEEEDVLFPSLFGMADFMDAEDGDCSGEKETVHEIQCGASPVIMNEVDNSYFVLFSGDLAAPSPNIVTTNDDTIKESWKKNSWRSTYARVIENKHETVPFDSGHLAFQGDLDVYVSEGYRIRLLDNYSISNGGTPFDEANPGLQFGIMRSSGANAHVRYYDDPDDDENEAWEVVPGDGAIDHPDTCDSYGNEWDYDGSYTITPAKAPAKLRELFPNSDAPFYEAELGYITSTTWLYVRDSSGQQRSVLIATGYSRAGITITNSGDIRYFVQLTLEQLQELSRSSRHMIVEVDSCDERGSTLVQLCKLAYGGGGKSMTIDNGVGSRFGRFSLKLRAEKLNPYYDPTKAESSNNRRYLTITNENLRQRGLADQFYKEYSFWVRNARIVKRTVRMTLAQLLTIDKTKRVTVGDVTGFIRKMQYSVSNETGLGNVILEIMYI
jgi:hypothetical protein